MSTDQVFPVLGRCALALLLLTLAADATARTARLGIARLTSAGVSIEAARFELRDAPSALHLEAKVLATWAAQGGLDLKADCALVYEAAAWSCAGDAGVGGAHPQQAKLLVKQDSSQYLLQLTHAGVGLRLAMPKEGDADGVNARLTGLPLAWLQPALAAKSPAARFVSGTLDAEAHYEVAQESSVSVSYTLRDAGLDTRDGSVALAGLTAKGDVVVDWRHALRIHHAGVLQDAELLWGSFFTKLPATPVALDFDTGRSQDGAWQLERVRYEDKNALALQFMGRLHPASSDRLTMLDLQHVDAVFPAAYERYAKGWLSTRGFGDLALRGRLSGRARWDGDALVAFASETSGLDIVDGAGRFGIEGIAGSLAWERERELPMTSVMWQSARVYRLSLGGAHTQWLTKDGSLGLAMAVAIPLAGGTLEIPQLTVRPDSTSGERWRAAFNAYDIDLGSVSEAFGWPRFPGKLGGAIPAIRYVGERIELDGGLFLSLFDGSVNLTNMALERPFGVAPSLAADIVLNKLDLQPLTAAFGFGEITGRLSGHIAGLRVVDWAPVAFDAELHTEGNGKLSQRAVNNLTSVGGGGLAAGLQASLLRLFDTFGYNRIALRCRLHDNICQMGGIDSYGAGYTIVEGRGLPRVTVVGHQADVDWTTLVARLKAATSGTAPIIH